MDFKNLAWQNMCNKITIFTILSVQFNGVKHIHIVGLPFPLSIFRTFLQHHVHFQKSCVFTSFIYVFKQRFKEFI